MGFGCAGGRGGAQRRLMELREEERLRMLDEAETRAKLEREKQAQRRRNSWSTRFTAFLRSFFS